MREDLRRSQDKEYWARLTASGVRWGFSPEPLVVYNGLRAGSVSRNETRFANIPSPEMWSRDIWPLLDSRMEQGFRPWYVERARRCAGRPCKQGWTTKPGPPRRRRSPRTRGPGILFTSSPFATPPGELNRLLWPAGSRVKGLVREVRGTQNLMHVYPTRTTSTRLESRGVTESGKAEGLPLLFHGASGRHCPRPSVRTAALV